ncbi:MAG: translation initiation factor IF-2 [Clostridia bacterium]|nr:translation initiation factor IF-2 [Clostridia bacterium]
MAAASKEAAETQPKITRVKKSVPANDTDETVKKSAVVKKQAETEVVEKVQETADAKSEKAEPAISEEKPKEEFVKVSSFSRNMSSNINVEIDVGGIAETKPKERPASEQNTRSAERAQRGGERQAQQGDRRNGNQNDRRPQRGDERRNVNREGGRDSVNQRNGDRAQRQQRNISIPSVDPAVAAHQDSRRNDKAPERPSKKERKENLSRPGNAPQKDKYKSAKKFIGESKGVSEVFSDDFSYSGAYEVESVNKKNNAKGKKDKRDKKQMQRSNPVVIATLTHVKLPPVMTVKEFAETIKKTSAEVIKKLMLMGVMATLNQEIDFDTATLIAGEFNITTEPEVIITDEEILFHDDDDENDPEAVGRPPVVVVMGHVDHGKTSLLDAIRSTSVTTGEAGGITQHIGAYTVRLKGRKITFLDTPGHEAFTAMRARGAQVTDVAILVVAADDGVMPQTIEAINHAKAANVSIVVAVNKIDKEGANPERVKQEMAEHGLVAEEWGGDIPFIPVSAKKHENIEMLLETVLLSADILELKANPKKQVKGTVIEAKLDKNRGPVATLLVQRGTLRPGDAVISDSTFGHVRTMTDDKGNALKEAGPSTPVEITGLPEVPEAGKVFYVVNEDEKRAKRVAETRRNAEHAAAIGSNAKVSLDDLFSQIQAGKMKDLNIIVKADVRGSVEAVKQSLEKLSNDEVRVKTIHGGVGGVTESDVLLAEASNAIIIGFNVRPIANAGEIAAEKGVDVRLYRVIYDAINDIEDAMNGMLEPEYKEVVQGHAEIRKTFKVSGVGTIAGAYVTNGKIVRNSNVRIVRDGIIIHEGKLASLKRFKDDAKEVAQGFECGLSFERYDDLKEGDTVECFLMEEIKRNG